jgi:NAD(P)-dependent dehydrogenase (short-subunit alcohol dehydrogenase family)
LPPATTTDSRRDLGARRTGGISAFAGIGAYHASNWGLAGFSQALAPEVAGFGIHVTLIEPGGSEADRGRRTAAALGIAASAQPLTILLSSPVADKQIVQI